MASLRFNKKIYAKAAIDQAAEEYADVLRATQRARGSYYEVDLQTLGGGADDVAEGLAKEFANYVLYATLVARRA